MADSTTPESQTPATSQAPAQPILKPHNNTVVPHAIADYDTDLVQLNVWAGTKWVNIFDGNDFKNMNIDLHRVAKVVEGQVAEIDKAVKRANDAMDQANQAVDASSVNSDAIVAQSSAISEAKAATDSAMSRAESAWNVATGAKEAVTDFDPLLNQAQSDAKAAGSSAAVLRADMDKVTSLVNDPKTGLNATYQTATGNATTISNVKSDVYQLETTATGLTSRVGNLESKTNTQETAIEQNKTAIALKAEQTDVNTLKGNVTDLQAKSITQANEIENKVTRSDVTGMLTGYATQEYTQSLVTQKADDWNLNLARLQTDVNAIKTTGGGVNLVEDSEAEFSGKGYWFHEYNLASLTELTPGKTYTMSFSARVDDKAVNCNQHVFVCIYDPSWSLHTVRAIAPISTDYQWVTYTFTVPEGITDVNCISVYLSQPVSSHDTSDVAGTGYIRDFMIEEGTVAHDWSPAPSDMATVTSVTNLSATVDGLKSTVANKADQSQLTQLSNLVQSKVSSSDFNSKITQLSNDINLRVTKDNLLSQINLEAGGDGLIQVANGKGKLFIDADSVVISGKEFIPSAAITDIAADKITSGTLDAGAIRVVNLTADSIHGGTLDMGSMNVKNLSANDIAGGTLESVVVKAGTSDQYFQTSQNNIYWVKKDGTSLIGNDTYLNDGNGLTIADTNNILLTTWGGATVNEDGSITNNSGNSGHPKIVVDKEGSWNPKDPYGSAWVNGPGNAEIVQWVGNKEYSLLENSKGFLIRLDDSNNKSEFDIQKDNCIGAYFGGGSNGNQIEFDIAGDGSGFNVNGPLHVTGAKNSIVQTSQGWLAINAYETTEYYFGDIGENNTGNAGRTTVGIDRIFKETVNTDIQYQVFVTPYSDAHVWVEQRYNNRFVVCSDKPNAEFGWELKAKRKGYEDHRLRKVDAGFKASSVLNKGDF